MSSYADIRKAAEAGVSWGRGLAEAGKLPFEHTMPLPGFEMGRKTRACADAFDRGLFHGYLQAVGEPVEVRTA